MDNNKQRNPQVNKCAKCGKPTLTFIWTSSRTVNGGIRSMYTDQKICAKCYKQMCKVYPSVELKSNKTFERHFCCPLCFNNKWSAKRRNIINDPVNDKMGDVRKKTDNEGNGIEGDMCTVIYCSACGYVEDVD